MERLVVLRGGGRIGIEHLPAEIIENANTAQPTERVGYGVRIESTMGMMARPPSSSVLPSLNPRPGTNAMTMPVDFGSLPPEGLNLIEFIELLENSLITQALARTDNNRNQAAKLLGMNRTTLVERIKKRKLTEMNPRSEEL